MQGKRILAAIALMIMPVSFLAAQEKANPSYQSDLEAIKGELKSQEDRINKLSLEVGRLTEALREKGISVAPKASSASAPKASPANTPKAPAANPSATVPGTVGVDNASPAGGRTHVVAKGETLTQIAKQYGVTVADIEQLNNIQDAKKLQIGQTLKIPGGGAASPSPSPSAQE
ncbi:MAG: LysM peptidoglycan-binding domain-containing protein [Verrucomicrobia bacterium]|nr:LysM peptidoglycan-binding domain-containing protein [Verrucomicrobiota bacterium]MBV9276101.1 LysM peptidoglycan-binding domain-containing protein [Verrucomicrobiota bacterium]